MRTRRLALALAIAGGAAPAGAQWLNYPTPGIPRLPDGKPNLNAPAPRTAEGKPDLTGVWMHELTSVAEMKRLYGDVIDDRVKVDVPGMEIGTQHKYGFNILLDFTPGESPMRAEALGIDVRGTQRWAFALAGAFAGLAGGLYAFSKGSISPETLAIPRSVDALVIVLLGGLNALAGPLLGAAAFTWLSDTLARVTVYWHAVLGAAILLIVIAFPMGIGGAIQKWTRRPRRMGVT